MALMIPDKVEAFTTQGEGQFYRFLATAARPDSNYIAWYLPDINGREPDFLFFSDKVGLIIFEVKDWVLDQIREANPHYFRLQIGSKIEDRKNPVQQAREYFSYVMDKIKEDRTLVSKDPVFHGNPKIPVNWGIVFPNINKYEYIAQGLDSVIGIDKIFFGDDIHPASDICEDETGKGFLKALQEKFTPPFRFAANGKELHHLKQLIFPTVKIEPPDRDADKTYQHRIQRIKILDHQQEALARQFDGGHHVISGPSGSGKTLILVHKAAFLKQYNPQINNILFVCYNVTLVNYIKRLLTGKNVPFGANGVTVKHFYELCADIIDEQLAYENEDADYYQMVQQEALEKVQYCEKKYDAVLVDEGQDFNDKMLKVVTALLNPDTDNLTLSIDDNQNIYGQDRCWDTAGINASGHVHKIPCTYRNTREIANFASRFIAESPKADSNKKTGRSMKSPEFSDFQGPRPEIKQFDDFEKIVSYVAQKTAEIVKGDGCPYSEIAVLYAMKYPGKNRDIPLPQIVESALASQGILSNWISENYQTKKTHDITTNSVTISTIHGAKGLDYSVVFLLGTDYLEPREWSLDQLDRLIYVGITRARYQLFIPYVREDRIIDQLQACLKKIDD